MISRRDRIRCAVAAARHHAGRARDGAVWVAPFLAIAALTAVMVGMGIIVLIVVSERDDERAAREAVREGTLINRRLIERGNPCLPDDDPGSEACMSQAERDLRLADALAAVQAQHDEQARQVADAVDRLVELQNRQHGVRANAGATPRPPARPAPRVTAEGPTAPAAPATPATTAAPPAPPPTTPCPIKGKRPKECRG